MHKRWRLEKLQKAPSHVAVHVCMFLKQGKEQWRKGDWWVPAPKVRAHGLPACPYCKQHLGCFLLKFYSQFLPSTGDPLQWSSAFWSCKKGLFFRFSPEISDPHPKSAMDHLNMSFELRRIWVWYVFILHYLALHHTGNKFLHLIAWNDLVIQSL